jgi:hypothetical protein
VDIAEESAIILWDARSRTEHFIRRATFASDTPDFGFLVPTPTQPALAEASDAAFTRLDKLTEPVVLVERRKVISGAKGMAPEASPNAPAPVRVLDVQRVAGYDAVVLEADNAAALNQWLGKNGYAARPDLTEWLEPYVKAHWKLTAFKIAKQGRDRPGVATSAVRMTFSTDRPFFPYSEPAQQRQARQGRPALGGRDARLLRVFLLADRRMAGTLGDGKEPWPGRTVWADRLDIDAFNGLMRQLKLLLPLNVAPLWLTVFEDPSSPRPGTADVFFAPSQDQSTVKRPPVVRYENYQENHVGEDRTEKDRAGEDGTEKDRTEDNFPVIPVVLGGLAGVVIVGLGIWLGVRSARAAE